MKKVVFIKCSLSNTGEVVFKYDKPFEAEITSTEWLIKNFGVPLFINNSEFYHLKHSDFNKVYSNCSDGNYSSYIWCEYEKIEIAKKKCVKELIRQKHKMLKYIEKKEMEYLDYKNKVTNFLNNYDKSN